MAVITSESNKIQNEKIMISVGWKMNRILLMSLGNICVNNLCYSHFRTVSYENKTSGGGIMNYTK